MTFGEKVRNARVAEKLTQGELAKAVGTSMRTIQYYEMDERMPRNSAMLLKLAGVLKRDSEYFLSDEELAQVQREEEFLASAKAQYGLHGKQQAQRLLVQTAALFAGGELEDEDQEDFMRMMTEIYFDAKARARQKYAPKHPRTEPGE